MYRTATTSIEVFRREKLFEEEEEKNKYYANYFN